MPPVIGSHPFQVNEQMESQRQFHLVFGEAFGQWALVEERLSYWFHVTSGMPFNMARTMFFTPRVFQARTDLLAVALEHTTATLRQGAREFLRQAITKAGKLSSFRNLLAHGEQCFDARSDSPTFRQTILISGRLNAYKAADSAITVARLSHATANYRELAKIIMDALEFVEGLPSGVPLEECLRQLNAQLRWGRR